MASQIEKRYGVPLPIDVLWRELEKRYGSAVVAELQQVHRQATKRYNRAAQLNTMRRHVSHWELRGHDSERMRRYRAILADPQAYIDAEPPYT